MTKCHNTLQRANDHLRSLICSCKIARLPFEHGLSWLPCAGFPKHGKCNSQPYWPLTRVSLYPLSDKTSWRQRYCRGACQMSELLETSESNLHGFEASGDLAVRRLSICSEQRPRFAITVPTMVLSLVREQHSMLSLTGVSVFLIIMNFELYIYIYEYQMIFFKMIKKNARQ